MKNQTSPLPLGALAAAIVLAVATTQAGAAGPAPLPRVTSLDSLAVATGAQPARGHDRFIVKYRDGSARRASPAQLQHAVGTTAARAGVMGQGASTRTVQHLRRTAAGAEVLRFSRALDAAEANTFLAQLRADPEVEYAQPDFLMQAYDYTPDDPYFEELQWHFTRTDVGIAAPAAWDVNRGEGVVVAVLDTGYIEHPDLVDNLVPGYDFITDPVIAGDGDGRDADARDPGDWTSNRASSWHGTHVAGTVAAVADNGIGLAGVAFNARVQPVRVLGRGGGFTSDIADAIIWASGGQVPGVPDNPTPAEVLNLSLGGPGACAQNSVMQTAINDAVGRGATVVVAAGNDNANADNHSPASCGNVITVGASGVDGGRSYFSNFGTRVALSAPGGSATSGSDPIDRWIWSLGNNSQQAPDPEGYNLMGAIGTSQASPHVAGIVALMQSARVAAEKDPLTPMQVRDVLRATATPFKITPPAARPQGSGIANAAKAVELALQDMDDTPAELIANRVPATGLSAMSGEVKLYRLAIPAGVRSVNIRTYGGTGDADLYVAHGQPASATTHDRASARAGNAEAITLTNPAAGDYYIAVTSSTGFNGVTLSAIH